MVNMPSTNREPTSCGIIAVLTDFGLEGPYVSAMKAVALSICPCVKIVDITHTIDNFDVEVAAYILYMVFKYFPKGTIFVGVVDPGVGSSRRAVAIATNNYLFIGPDNGLLVPAAESDGILSVRLIENDRYFRKPVSRSFHGRDIFMPVAAHIACGVPLDDIGRSLDAKSLARLDADLGYMEKRGNCVYLKVLYVDKFGNVILSTPFDELRHHISIDIGSKIKVKVGGKELTAIVEEVFSIVPVDALVLYKNSFGFAELAVNQGSARDLLNVKRKDYVILCE